MEVERGDASALGLAVDALLARHPAAVVLALDDQGVAVPVPPSLPSGDRPTPRVGSAMDLVSPDDWPAVIMAWTRTRESGAATLDVTSVAGEPATLQFLDATSEHGVFVAVLLPRSEHDDRLLAPFDRPRSRIGTWRRNELARVVEVDDHAVALLGWTAEDLADRTPLELIHPDDRERAVAAWMGMLVARSGVHTWRVRHLTKSGRYRWLESVTVNRIEDPEHRDVLSEMVDVTAEVEAEARLETWLEMLRRLAGAVSLGVVYIRPDSEVVFANDALHRLVGTTSCRSLDEQFRYLLPEDHPALTHALQLAVGHGTDSDLELRFKLPEVYRLHVCQVAIRVVHGDEDSVRGVVLALTDVSERMLMRQELEARETYDTLTHCHNRRATLRHVDDAIREGAGVALIVVDLVGFAAINHDLGCAGGDQTLSNVSRRLRRVVRSDDIVGRLDGDQFALVCPHVATSTLATEVGQRVARAMAAPVQLAAHVQPITAAIGIAWTAGPAVTTDELLDAAYGAMGTSKGERKGHPHLVVVAPPADAPAAAALSSSTER